MKFDFDNDRPIYVQLVEKLRILIVSNYYEPGSRLPSVREMALSIKVNPNTIQKALFELEDSKLIYTDRTNGKYVTNDRKLIDKIKKEIANDFVKKYLSNMNSIGYDIKNATKYLQEMGGNK